jgi:NTE family protein
MYSFKGVETISKHRALVLGGGGAVGRAWLTGLVYSLASSGIELGAADCIIGTSAGSSVGARLAASMDLSETSSAAILPPTTSAIGAPSIEGMTQLLKAMAQAAASEAPHAARAKSGEIALAASTVSEAESLRRPAFAELEDHTWPSNFFTTAINARSGQLKIWSRHSNVPLSTAVASSCALPAIWPPITITGERYIDGGVRSMLNADLVSGYNVALVVSCFSLSLADNYLGSDGQILNNALHAELAQLQSSGTQTEVIEPAKALMTLTNGGRDMLNNAHVPDAYQIGREQGFTEAGRVLRLWSLVSSQS